MRWKNGASAVATVNSVPRAAPASISSPSVRAWRSPNGLIGARLSVMSNIWLSRRSAYKLVRASAAIVPRSAIIGEHRRRRTGAEAGDRDAIRRRQSIDEAVGRASDPEGAPEADVRLVDRDDDQPAAGGAFVRAVALGQRRRRRRGF